MTRYTAATGIEAEYEPGSRGRVLRNLLGIKTKTEIDRAEREALAAVQKRYFRSIDQNDSFTAAFICQMHREWLGDLYEWAGQYRTVELSKDDFVWPPAYLAPHNMAKFEAEVLAKHTPWPWRPQERLRFNRGCPRRTPANSPISRGQCRIARWLADLMAGQAGFPPPLYKFQGRGSRAVRSRYLAAVTTGYAGRYSGLETFFEDAIRLRLGD